MILEQLSRCYQKERNVSPKIDSGDKERILQLSNALRKWITAQTITAVKQADGTTKEMAGASQLTLIAGLQAGAKDAIAQVKTEGDAKETLSFNNFELITWLLIGGSASAEHNS